MEDVAELHINIGMNRFLELMRTYSVLKDTGPFSWQQPFRKHGVRLLYFGRCTRLGSDRRMCRIFEHVYWLPKVHILPWPRLVIRLYVTRVRDEQVHLLVRCHAPHARDTIFPQFVSELYKLRDRFAKASEEGVEEPPLQEVKETEPAWSPGSEPWTQIPDHGWDRQALDLWWQGLTVPEIANRLHMGEKTVRNRLTTMRKVYGEKIVPTARQLRKMHLR